MAAIRFYTKLGCGNGKKQLALLKDAQHEVEVVDLLKHSWTTAGLRAFFGELPVNEWFNRAAPAIKSGAIDPNIFDEPQALALMLQDPLFIRRPLMEIGDEKIVGFDQTALADRLGITPSAKDLERCSKTSSEPSSPCNSET